MKTPQANYQNKFDAFTGLVDYSLQIIDAQDGMPLTGRQHHALLVFQKLVAHAHSLRRILPTPNSRVAELWDLGSVCAIARCVIDAFDVLFYVTLEEVPDEEREFRSLLQVLHGENRKLEMYKKYGSTSPEVIAGQAEATLKEVLAHGYFTKLDPNAAGKIKGGEAPQFHNRRDQRTIAAEISKPLAEYAIVYLSQ